MKNKENTAATSLVKEKEFVAYSEENMHLFTKEEQIIFEKLDKKMPKFTKYLIWQKREVIKKTQTLFNQTPSISIKEAIIQILGTLPDFLPPENLLKVIGYITTTWQTCESKALKKVS